MTTFVYDQSFEGLLTCVFDSYRLGKPTEIIPEEKYQGQLFSKPLMIRTDPDKAQRVVTKLAQIHWEVLSTVQHCYLSGNPEKEKLILEYIKLALAHGPSVNDRYANPVIGKTLEFVRNVTREAHRFQGFLRFQELQDGTWYAACEPDNCIVPLVAKHCRNRFPEQNWIIHDVRRDIAALYQDKVINIYNHTEITGIQDKLSTAEQKYQNLWKTFFKNIAITERKNPKLQQQFMPKKYWKYLIEKN